MRAAVTSEARLVSTADGACWARSGPAYREWSRYLCVFDQVRVLARVTPGGPVEPSWRRVDGPGVEVWPLPHYVGPTQYLLRRARLVKSLADGVAGCEVAIVRAPSPIGSLLTGVLGRQERQYGLEVIGDPHDLFAPGVMRHPLRPLLRAHSAAQLRKQCQRAGAVCYVTRHYLQGRYPAGPGVPTVACSDVELTAEAFVSEPPVTARVGNRGVGELRLISVGSLAQPYKGIDVLIRAVGQLIDSGTPVRLVHVGAGRCRSELEALVSQLDLDGNVTFAGEVAAGRAVRDLLDEADLFVMPSLTEGLPRALLEAMARGLPAVASDVGGIPELLPASCLVTANRPELLAERIRELASSPEQLRAHARRNHIQAKNYALTALMPIRDKFYRAVSELAVTQPRTGMLTPATEARSHG